MDSTNTYAFVPASGLLDWFSGFVVDTPLHAARGPHRFRRSQALPGRRLRVPTVLCQTLQDSFTPGTPCRSNPTYPVERLPMVWTCLNNATTSPCPSRLRGFCVLPTPWILPTAAFTLVPGLVYYTLPAQHGPQVTRSLIHCHGAYPAFTDL